MANSCAKEEMMAERAEDVEAVRMISSTYRRR
jgi:hypothetical protein